MKKISIGISSCLLGELVRFDGSHKRDAYINGTLSYYFEFMPVCFDRGGAYLSRIKNKAGQHLFGKS